MRNNLLFTTALLFLSLIGFTQTVLFSDSMETGTSKWVLTGSWGLSTFKSHSPTHSLNESPGTGTGATVYANNLDISATMATGVDLSTWYSAQISFWTTYKIESGFDYMHIEVSTDDFATYTNVVTFDGGVIGNMTQKTYSLSGFCAPGNTNVKVRFHFTSDEGLGYDGMYIDDVAITGSLIDDYPPMIIHTARPFYEGRLLADTLTARLLDPSGIASTTLNYFVDGGLEQVINGTLISGTDYQYILPAFNPGEWIEYYFTATDASVNNFSDTSGSFEFIAGNHIIRDNGNVDFYSKLGPGAPAGSPTGVAVKVVLGNTNLTTMLIRNYTDESNPNNDMLVHVWNDSAGIPGTDVITPFIVTPEASLTYTSPMTRVDLRSFTTELTGITGTYYIGFTVPTGVVNITMTQPGVYNRSYNLIDGVWQIAAGTDGNDDYHFRAVTSLNTDVEGPSIVNDSISTDYHSVISDQIITAHIIDESGIGSAGLTYWVDAGAPTTINPVSVNADVYTFLIPAQTAGAWVKYIFTATDNSFAPITTETDTFRYIAGNYLAYDYKTANYYAIINTTGTAYNYVAEKVSFGTTPYNIVAALIWNYFDIATPSNTPNNDMEFHLFGDDGTGLPGTDLITAIAVPSEAGPNAQRAYTRVDLRGVAGASNLTGDVFAGFTVPVGDCAFLYDTITPYLGHSFANTGYWLEDVGNNYHIRVITSDAVTTVSSLSGKSNLSLYPNPSEGYFFVDFNNKVTKQISVIVYDITGKIVYLDNSSVKGVQAVDLTKLNKGVYYLKVQTGNETYNQKIVLQ